MSFRRSQLILGASRPSARNWLPLNTVDEGKAYGGSRPVAQRRLRLRNLGASAPG